MKHSFFLFAALINFAFISCIEGRISSVDREDLFSLEIGPMEDQIALYRLEGDRGIRRIGFTMRDGLFYITDGNSGKITKFNSYGDLLFMIYNEETNPPPISLITNISEEEQATRWAYSYPLEEPGLITVDSRRHIHVEDRLPRQAQRFDPETNAALDGIILQFDQDGRYVNYLGQDGIGGNPFPRIVGLTTAIRDELAVICRLPDGWNVYWFNASGTNLYLIKISDSMIPVLPDWPEAQANIEKIIAAPDARRLYIKVDYSRDKFDPSTGTRMGEELINSVIWTLNAEDGSYISSVEIPPYEISENGRQQGVKAFYNLLGVSRAGKALLYFPVETGFALLYADTQTHQQRRGSVNFSNDEIRYNDFFLSIDGILSAMLADNYNVKLVWWRTDRFMDE